ncbi:PAS domain S-box protein [Actinoplanes sp. NPDC048988]|uniref:PAS domain S-box protein n=1 Tax=Actinoplanes sp. NPDC048988 TaxID=3363901 RepID=UPI00371D7650
MVLRHTGHASPALSARLLDGHAQGGGVLDRLTRLASRLLNVPVAAVSLLGDDRQVFLSTAGEPSALAYSPCRHVVETDGPLIIGDIRADGRVRDRAELTALGVAAYAGFPLRSPRGETLGSFCVVDVEPREWTAEQLSTLDDLAAAAESELAARLAETEIRTRAARAQAQLDTAKAVTVNGIEARFRSMFESSPIGVALVGLDGSFLRVNAAIATITGYSLDELLAGNFQSLTHPADLEASLDMVTRMVAGEAHTMRLHKRYMRRDGTPVWCMVSVVLLRDDENRPLHFLMQMVDIDVERRSQDQAEALAARETYRLRTTISIQREVAAAASDLNEALRLIAERTLTAIPADGAAVGLIDGPVLRAAAKAGSLANREMFEVPTGGSMSGLAVRTRTTLRCDDTADDPRIEPTMCEALGIRSLIIAPLLVDGEPVGVLTVSSGRAGAFDEADEQQLTLLADALSGALRHAEEAEHRARLLRQANDAVAALQDSEARFRSAFDNSPLGMALTSLRPDNLGIVLQANAAMAAITGFPIADLVGESVHKFHHPYDHVETDGHLAALCAGDVDTAIVSKRYRHADGHLVWVQIHGAVVRDENGKPHYLVTQVQDVTARREIDEQLRQRAQLLDLTQDAVILRDLGGRVLYWNPAAERVYGWPADLVIGHDLDNLLGTEFIGDDRRSVTDALLSDGLWAGEIDHLRADGRHVRVLSRKAVQCDSEGNPFAILSINTDVTASREAEQARDAAIADLNVRNRELEEANQLKQDLIGMLGHEIGNPLCSILGYTETIADTWDVLPAERQRAMLNAIDRNAQLLNGIVREVLAMVTLDAGKLTASPETIAVRPHLEAVVASADPGVRALDRFGSSSRVQARIDCPETLTASVQPGHLDQMLTNLISNAAKYGGGATALTASATPTEIRVVVRDEGPGVPAELQPNLFTRFARAECTARTVKGTGLGLYIVRELARANHGDLHYEPAPGGGSMFVITLPRAD